MLTSQQEPLSTLLFPCSLHYLENEYADPILILCSSRQFFSCLRIAFSKSPLFLVSLDVAISWHHLSKTVNPSIDHPCNFGEALSAFLSVYLLLMTSGGLGIFPWSQFRTSGCSLKYLISTLSQSQMRHLHCCALLTPMTKLYLNTLRNNQMSWTGIMGICQVPQMSLRVSILTKGQTEPPQNCKDGQLRDWLCLIGGAMILPLQDLPRTVMIRECNSEAWEELSGRGENQKWIFIFASQAAQGTRKRTWQEWFLLWLQDKWTNLINSSFVSSQRDWNLQWRWTISLWHPNN